MKHRVIKIGLCLAFICLMVSFGIQSNMESRILGERRFAPAPGEHREVELKGRIYFVNENTYLLTRGSKYSFVISVIAMFLLIAAARRAQG